MRVCRRCGVYAPPETMICDGCGSDLAEQATTFPTPRYRFAAVKLERRCPKCARSVPIDVLPADGAVTCYGCGAVDPVPDEEWSKVLGRIHAAADLIGLDPEGFEPSAFAIDQVNKFAARARISAGVVFAADEADALSGWLPDDWRVWAAPGIPTQADTYEPQVLQADRRGGIEVLTGSAVERYVLDPRWTERHSALVGAISREALQGRTDPDIVVDGLRWSCPACNAPLSPTAERSRIRCPECRQVARIPPKARYAASPDPRPTSWWLVFDGPSAYRRYLERDPTARGEPYPDDRPLAEQAPAPRSDLWAVARMAYLVGVPFAFLAVAVLLWAWR